MESEAVVGLAGAPVVLGLVAAVRQSVNLPDRWTPLLSLALGIVWNVSLRALEATNAEWGATVVLGVLSGLSASGLYSGGKSTAGR